MVLFNLLIGSNLTCRTEQELYLSNYRQLPFSRLRLSRITAYLEVKIWSGLNMKIQQQVIKYCGNEEKLLQISPLFHNIYFRSKITYMYSVVKCGYSIYFFPLICRDTDISKYFRESLGLRDNESQLYLSGYTQEV